MYPLFLHGRKSVQLQKFHNLGVSLQNVFSFSSAAAAKVTPSKDVRKGNSFTVSYLVGSLGLATKLAESISRKVSLVDKANADSVLNLLRSYGFTDSQISTIIEVYPKLLITDIEKSLSPNLQFLKSRGASTSEITKIISEAPHILGLKKGKSVSIYYDVVKEIVEADDDNNSKLLFLSLPAEGSQHENRIRNLSALREIGVPQRLLFPLLISKYAPVSGKERFQESLNKVIEMGFDPTTPKFLNALGILQRVKDKTLKEKVEVYKRLGFTVEEVWEIFKKHPFALGLTEKNILNSIETLLALGFSRDEVVLIVERFPSCIGLSAENILNSYETFLGLGFNRDDVILIVKRFPMCIGLSAELVKKKTEFFVKKMNWALKDVVSNPSVLGLSIEKRIVPRCNVIKALMSKGLIGRDEVPTISSVLKRDDEVFLNKYVKNHDGMESELMGIFTAGRGS